MKLLGITAEYNPFHNGHAYHIREALKRSGCDSVIVLQSGNFVQRGTPAIMDKYDRAEAALRNGADIVIELPVFSAAASAELFAEGAVRAFSALGVDAVSYGIECDGKSVTETHAEIRRAAAFFAEESEHYKELLKEGLSSGRSYPAARLEAYRQITGDDGASLSTPNNILAVEYEKAMIRKNVAFSAVPIERIGSGYHDTEGGEFASATAIRSMTGGDSWKDSVPENLHKLYAEALSHAVQPDDFSGQLFSAFHGKTAAELEAFADISGDTARRLAEAARQPFTWTSLAEAIRERSHTLTHVNRTLCHVLLGITKEADAEYRAGGLPYLHVLGIRQEAAPLLGKLAESSSVPLLIRLNKDMKALPEAARKLFETELSATALYSHVLFGKGAAVSDERLRKFLTV
ncbi:MAG: nucleotidyltransferase family protein [Lachnospiraceae bacterium]|nr:nucleotidyltransferase family protein [Lachnospiraceae bacterium]